MRFTLSDYAKIAIYAIKNRKVSEFVDLKIQKDRDKKKNKRKAEYVYNEIYSEEALKKIFPNQTFVDKIFVELESHIESFINSKKDLKYPTIENPYQIEFGLGKNICRLLYFLVKFSQADVIVETGVANGFSSSYILLALDSLNKGKLISIDYLVMPWHAKEKVGQAIPEPLRKWHELIIGNSMTELEKLKNRTKYFDIFMHDSSHTYKHMMNEYQIVWLHLKNGGFLLSDDVSQNDAFLEFSYKVGKRAIIIRKDERGHFGIIRK